METGQEAQRNERKIGARVGICLLNLLYQPALTTTHAPICGVRWS